MSNASDFLNEFMSQHMARLAAVAGRRTRGLSPTAAEEILSASLLAAWEQREQFDPTRGNGAVEGKLLAWFDGLCRNERKRFHRKELPGDCVTALAALVENSAAAEVEAVGQKTIDEVIAQLPPKKQAALAALANGDSVRTVAAATGLNRGQVKELKRRLRWQLVTNPDFLSVPTPRAPADPEMRELAQIDRQIAALTSLEFPPHHGKECTPCVHCMWYDGYRPADRKRVHAEIADAEIREAQRAIYERKVIISAARRGERIEPSETLAPVEAEIKHVQSVAEEAA